MLEIRMYCENCGRYLPNDSTEAMICTYECTYCRDCVETVLKNVCPNCEGGFENRPTRPKGQLKKNPPNERKIINPVNRDDFHKILQKYKNIDTRER